MGAVLLLSRASASHPAAAASRLTRARPAPPPPPPPRRAGVLPAGRPASNIVRVLAPNGQPRKVPLAALQPQAGGAGTAPGGAARGAPGALLSSSLNGRGGGGYSGYDFR
jgi:hypothetical protein